MAKKKQVSKLKSKKLEDRIAPGMVGGGLVDPGMVDAVEVDSGSDGVSEQVDQTQTEHLEGESHSQDQYLDEANSEAPVEDYQDPSQPGEYDQDQEIQSQDNYDEFSQPEMDSEFHEEPGEWQEPDWVSANADGSVDINPPEGVGIDADAGIANFPVELANEELPLPDDVQVTADGGLQMQLPEGSEYLAESNQLILQDVPLEEVPESFDAYSNPDGSVMVNLPDDGVQVDVEAGTIEFDNYYANEFTPENVEINENGSVDIHLPDEGVEYNDDGSIHMSAEASQFMDNPPADYYAQADYCECQPDGSVSIDPPEGVEVDGGIAQMDYEVANEVLEMPEEFEIYEDGSSSFNLPEGVEYNEAVNGLTFPEGEINLDEVPEGIEAHVNPDGSTTVMLQDGMEYDGEANQVSFDNYWTNEITPDQMNIEADGQVQIALPDGCEFYEDGSFSIPSEQVDFIEQDAPEYVSDIDFCEPMPDGGYQVTPPEGFEVNAQEGELSVPHEMIEEHIPLDDGIELHPDGTMSVQVPEGTEFNAQLNQLSFPEGAVHLDELPPEVNPQMASDGSITVTLQDGMSFDADSGTVNLDNYWTNELAPEPVEYTSEGNLIVDLPQDCEFHDDGSFSIPEGQVDFIENPDPSYCSEGPEWVSPNPDGSVTLEHCEHFEAHPEEGYISMDTEYINEGFDDYIPDDVTFYEDGTMSVQLPEGTLYDADAGSLTFPEGEMHMHEIPEGIDASLNANGSISVVLPEGIEYNAETGEVKMDQYWTNEITPDCVEFQPDGQCHIDMPHDSHYFDDGSVHINADSVDFVENPHPDYVDHGPEWVSDNPDGSVTVDIPESMELNVEEGYVSMNFDVAMEELGGDLIPEEIQLNSDGTIDMMIPEDIKFEFDEASNSFTLTELPEDFNPNEAPEFLDLQLNDEGQWTVQLPEGVDYNVDGGSLTISNEIVNEIAPEPIEFSTDGEFKINLPEDTQYFEEEGAFVISAESADFLDDHHQEGDEYQQYQQQAS